MAGGVATEKPDALPAHSSPADVRNSYATDATMVGRGYEGYGAQTYGHTPVSPVAPAPAPATYGHTVNGVNYGAGQTYAAPTSELPAEGYRGAHQYRSSNGTF